MGEQGILAGGIVAAVSAVSALGVSSIAGIHPLQVHPVIAVTAVSMGLRNAVVRKLAVPDMTTAVLTLTIAGLAADSRLAGGNNPRWQRRVAAILAMIAGAFAGARMLVYSISLPLAVSCVMVATCVLARRHMDSERKEL